MLSVDAIKNSQAISSSNEPAREPGLYEPVTEYQMPIFVPIGEDEFNQKQEEAINNIQYSHDEYIDLNGSFQLEPLTALLVSLIFTF